MTFQGWKLDETVVMFRFDYNASDEESEIMAEFSVANGDTLSWTSVASFQATVATLSSDRSWVDRLPNVWQADFLSLAEHVEAVLGRVEFAPAPAWAPLWPRLLE